MNIIGERVTYDTHREGEVLDIKDGNKIVIKFSDGLGTYQFPYEFTRHLTACNCELQNEIMALFHKQREEMEQEKQKREEEAKAQERVKDFLVPKRVFVSSLRAVGEKLTCNPNVSYGTNSRSVYEECCNQFGWKKNLAYLFGQQGRPLFAENATSEKYDVWFLSHNNWTGTEAKSWENIVSGDLQYIYETCENKLPPRSDNNYRVVFAKTSDNQYVFIGVYTYIDTKVEMSNSGIGIKRTYSKVSDFYPFK